MLLDLMQIYSPTNWLTCWGCLNSNLWSIRLTYHADWIIFAMNRWIDRLTRERKRERLSRAIFFSCLFVCSSRLCRRIMMWCLIFDWLKWQISYHGLALPSLAMSCLVFPSLLVPCHAIPCVRVFYLLLLFRSDAFVTWNDVVSRMRWITGNERRLTGMVQFANLCDSRSTMVSGG